MRIRKITIMMIFIMLLATGCSADSDLAVEEPRENENEIIIEPVSIVEVDLMYLNYEYVVGNEGLELSDDQYKPIKKAFNIVEEDKFFLDVIKELMIKPEGKTTLVSGFPETAELIGVSVNKDTLEVDFASDGLYGGSYQELGIIEQITRTVKNINRMNEYTKINQIRLLIDGEKAESLMGHISIAEPIIVE